MSHSSESLSVRSDTLHTNLTGLWRSRRLVKAGRSLAIALTEVVLLEVELQSFLQEPDTTAVIA